MRGYDKDAKQEGPQGQPPQKAKPAGERGRKHAHADAHGPSAHPEILRDGRLAHPANAAPRAELLSLLQQSHGNAYVQRVVAEAGGEKAQEPKPAAEPHAHGAAQNLDAGTRSQMESAFGEDFGDVRVHAGGPAGEAAERMGARAFTRGRDIYFNEGEYNPSTREGKELLAHELAHVAQQRGGARGAQADTVGAAGDAYETEAQEAAAAVTGGARHRVRGRAGAPAIQREEKQKQPSAPAIKTHPEAITPDKGSGTIDAGGRFSVAYAYTIVNKAQSVPLTLAVPEGVVVTATPVSNTPAGEYTMQNTGGTNARAVVISATNQMPRPPAFQVAFTQGNFTYVVVFHFPNTTPPKASASRAAAAETQSEPGSKAKTEK